MCDQRRLRPACACTQSDQSHCLSLECSMTVELLTKNHLGFLSLKGGRTGSSESTLVKMPHFWKSHVMAHFSVSQTEDYQEVKLSDNMVKFWHQDLDEEGQWHHLVLIFHRAGIMKNSSVSLFLDGEHVNTQKVRPD